jgi:PhnB protein
MTSIQPELWVERADQAVAFYAEAFGARVLHRVGEGDDIVAQLALGEAAFWVAAAGPDRGRFSPHAIGGATSLRGSRTRPLSLTRPSTQSVRIR